MCETCQEHFQFEYTYMYSILLFHRFKGTIFISESKEKVPPKTLTIKKFK